MTSGFTGSGGGGVSTGVGEVCSMAGSAGISATAMLVISGVSTGRFARWAMPAMPAK
ncbi:hypothetical protein [Thauera sp. SDU_THAU2]|uniref:hypothetical protein n=1 Tax=Thauera sp. SDU_THAU2 TaxID=3136633 RepID=UPI00311E3961